MVMTFEMTLYTPYMILADQELRDNDMFPHWPQNASRIELFGTEGLMVVGRHGGGWQVFDRPKDRKPVVVAQEYGRWSDREHRQDFCDAIRTDRRPNADIEEGHRSTLAFTVRQHQLSAGRRETAGRCRDRDLQQQRSGQRDAETRIPKALGNSGTSLKSSMAWERCILV